MKKFIEILVKASAIILLITFISLFTLGILFIIMNVPPETSNKIIDLILDFFIKFGVIYLIIFFLYINIDEEIKPIKIAPYVYPISFKTFKAVHSFLEKKLTDYTLEKIRYKDLEYYIYSRDIKDKKELVILYYSPNYTKYIQEQCERVYEDYVDRLVENAKENFRIHAILILCVDEKNQTFTKEMNTGVLQALNMQWGLAGISLKNGKLYIRKRSNEGGMFVYKKILKKLKLLMEIK